MKLFCELTEPEWTQIAPLIPELATRTESRGRPLTDTRAVLNASLWVLHTGGTWATLPRKYPAPTTCHRRFKAWMDKGTFVSVARILSVSRETDLYERARLRMKIREKSRAGEDSFHLPGRIARNS